MMVFGKENDRQNLWEENQKEIIMKKSTKN